MIAYTESAAAAPSPEKRPENRPNCKVLRMQSTPIGPTGAAMEKPSIIPFKKKLISMRIPKLSILYEFIAVRIYL